MGNCCTDTKVKDTDLKNDDAKVTNARGGHKTPHQDELLDNINSGPLQKFAVEALNTHNTYRKSHGVAPLTLNWELCKYSQNWADKLAKENLFEHSDCQWKGEVVGENIAMCSGQEMTGKYMTDIWYDEIADYNFDNPGYSGETGHFTQVVWKDSKELGVGFSKGRDGSYFAVANYFPPGNDVDSFEKNVLRKK
jgi:uncharacterized protein YkwD